MNKIYNLSIDDDKRILEISKVLSNQVRIDILKCVAKQGRSIQEIATMLNLPKSTVSINVSALEEAGLIMTTYQAGKHGSVRICFLLNEFLNIDLVGRSREPLKKTFMQEVPVGSYTAFKINAPTCGLISEKGFIGKDDYASSFYLPERFNAQLIWFRSGYVEYTFLKDFKYKEIKKISFSFEACAEVPGYRMDYPSDITVWVNGVEVCTKTYNGDFGGTRGLLTPDWLDNNFTQFGEFRTYTVDKNYTTSNGEFLSSIKLSDLNLDENSTVFLRIGVKEDAKNVGGINLFGEKCGNVARSITMEVEYVE